MAPERPYIFRTYKNLHRSEAIDQRVLDRNPGLGDDIPIWQVARATSTAPTYLAPLKIGDLEFLDGVMGANNPCEDIYDGIRRMNMRTGEHYVRPQGKPSRAFDHFKSLVKRQVIATTCGATRLAQQQKSFKPLSNREWQSLHGSSPETDQEPLKSSQETNDCNNVRGDEDSAAEKILQAPEQPKTGIPAWFQPKNRTLESIRTKIKSYLVRDEAKR
ncbi:hypothetical protein MMC07_000986 [Pseudocyphellaria aurata]|nr:hypothetical protein [Pseudocyphellaria aurata]